MDKQQTIDLLQECNAGSKMGVKSIDEALERVTDSSLKSILQENKNEHAVLGNEIHSLLIEMGSEEKDPPLMAKAMAWAETNIKLAIDNSSASVSDLITDGCNMGIKSLNKKLNDYPDADERAKNICQRLISMEEELENNLKSYL